jgi:hypothetical protein
MSPSRARRAVAAFLFVAVLAACHGSSAKSGAPGSTATGGVDVKTACAALGDLERSVQALNGVDVANPGASLTALSRAVRAYSAALRTFEQVGPTDLRPGAEAVRTAVVARHFAEATADRAAIDAWATTHCSSSTRPGRGALRPRRRPRAGTRLASAPS